MAILINNLILNEGSKQFILNIDKKYFMTIPTIKRLIGDKFRVGVEEREANNHIQILTTVTNFTAQEQIKCFIEGFIAGREIS